MLSKSPSQRRRNRGVILTFGGWQKLQQAKQAMETEYNGGQRYTVEQLRELTELRVSLHTISRILQRQVGVDKQSLESFFCALGLELYQGDWTYPVPPFKELKARQENPQHDWGEAMDVSVFLGRSEELVQLQQWVLEEHCRVVALLGMGGIGKSTLAVKLGQLLQDEFEVVVWRSLENAPPLEDLLASVLQFLLSLEKEDPVIAPTLDGKVSKLMECLKKKRCLLILDNAETVLRAGSRAGHFRVGYERYSQLFQRIGEVPHQSCVILTSREKPREIALLEGEGLPVRSLQLKGLQTAQGRELFGHKGQFTGTEAQWSRLIEHYGGNPLALKLVAAAVLELFDGSIADVLEYVGQGSPVFEDIRDLLDGQFNRLSAFEQEVMNRLALHREPVSWKALAENVAASTSKRQLPQAIKSLLQRSMVEKAGGQFWVQPVVREYVAERLVEQVFEETVEQRIEPIPFNTTTHQSAQEPRIVSPRLKGN